MKPKTQSDMLAFLRSPGITEYRYRGKAEERAAIKLEQAGKVSRHEMTPVQQGRHNRKHLAYGVITLL